MADHHQDEEETPQLSSDVLAALQDFYSERDSSEKRFEDLKAATDRQDLTTLLSMEMFTEDWNASQFWYSDDTATLLAKQLLEGATSETCIAVVSAPSVFIQLKNLLISGAYAEIPRISLLEFDKRFDMFPEFVHYDFQSPLKLPLDLKGKFDRIICDPPFLSTDCQTKAAVTVRWLSRVVPSGHPGVRVTVCTGERMEELIIKLYSGIRTTTYEPQHAQGRLSNDFRCYANYDCGDWS